jgi:hypothetical protein
VSLKNLGVEDYSSFRGGQKYTNQRKLIIPCAEDQLSRIELLFGFQTIVPLSILKLGFLKLQEK